MNIAINICDLSTFTNPDGKLSFLQILLSPVMTRDVVKCEKGRIDGDALLVREDVSQERWDAIYSIIRDGLGKREPIHKNKLRIYESKTGQGGWKRI